MEKGEERLKILREDEANKLRGSQMLKWFTDNFKQSEEECIAILMEAQRCYPFTIDKIHEGCIAIRGDVFKELGDLPKYIRLLGEMCDAGMSATKAGEVSRKTLLEVV